DEREPIEPRMRPSETQSLSDHRRSPVGGDDETGREALRLNAAPPWTRAFGDDASHSPAVAQEVDHANALADRDADLPRPLDERLVQGPPTHGERVRSVAVPRPIDGIVADQKRAVRRQDPHAPERPGSPRLDRREDTQTVQNPGALR